VAGAGIATSKGRIWSTCRIIIIIFISDSNNVNHTKNSYTVGGLPQKLIALWLAAQTNCVMIKWMVKSSCLRYLQIKYPRLQRSSAICCIFFLWQFDVTLFYISDFAYAGGRFIWDINELLGRTEILNLRWWKWVAPLPWGAMDTLVPILSALTDSRLTMHLNFKPWL